jgi:hypothetical protein
VKNDGARREANERGTIAAPRPARARIPVKLHRRVCLILAEDTVLAEELLANRKLAADIVGRLTDRVLLIRAGRVDAVVQELQRTGHTPAVVSGPPDKLMSGAG